MKSYNKGRFKPHNWEKYKGDPTNIIYRSGWELTVFRKLDENPSILEWSSEEVIIPYISPIDQRKHRYFPDIWARVRDKNGIVKTKLIEIKPKAQIREPKIPKKRSRKYIREVMEWGKNSAKWDATRAYCADRGWEFLILTEDDIFGGK